MAYIRWGQKTSEGRYSSSYVIGSPDGLINFDKGYRIPYEELEDWFSSEKEDKVREKLKERLELRDDELEIVCERLFQERDQGKFNIVE